MRAVSAGLAFVAFAVISNLDILLAKLFLPADDVGLYAALSTIGKVVMFLPGRGRGRDGAERRPRPAHQAARAPRAAHRRAAGRAHDGGRGAARRARRRSTIDRADVRQRVRGRDRRRAADRRAPAPGMALLYLLVIYSVAVEDRRWSLLLAAGIVLQIGAISLFHDSPAQIALVQAIVVWVVLLANEIGFHRLLMTPRGTTRRA